MSVQDKPLSSLLQDAAGDIADIVRKEAKLAQVEIKDNLHQALGGAIKVLLGAVILIPALTLALMALAQVLIDYDVASPWVASLIAAGVGAVIGTVLLSIGKKALKPGAIAPTRTIDNLKQDAQLVKDQAR